MIPGGGVYRKGLAYTPPLGHILGANSAKAVPPEPPRGDKQSITNICIPSILGVNMLHTGHVGVCLDVCGIPNNDHN